MISKKSNIAIVGAGKIAYSLTNALIKNNYKIKIIISSNPAPAAYLSKKFSINNYSDDLSELKTKIKVIFLSVPDNQIKTTANKLSNLNIKLHDSLFIHLSGAEDTSVLNSLKRKGALTASFHIMQTFPSKRIVNIENCYAAIETRNKFAEKFLFKLAADLKLKPFMLKSEDKPAYHLAGVFSSNFLAGNIYNTEKIFDINKSQMNYNNFDLLFPIIKSTLKNINRLGSAKALSGPVERGDLMTIKKHVSVLKKLNDSDEMNEIFISYIIQSLNLLNLIKSKYNSLCKEHIELKKFLLDELKKL